MKTLVGAAEPPDEPHEHEHMWLSVTPSAYGGATMRCVGCPALMWPSSTSATSTTSTLVTSPYVTWCP